jgi:hypothetical protein
MKDERFPLLFLLQPQGAFNAEWARQVTPKSGGYVSDQRGIWMDRISKYDRNPVLAVGREVGSRKIKRDCYGNRLNGTPEQQARVIIAKLERTDKAFAAWYRASTPAEVNAMIELLANGKEVRPNER